LPAWSTKVFLHGSPTPDSRQNEEYQLLEIRATGRMLANQHAGLQSGQHDSKETN
jgi:hypothetical protein